MLCSCMHYFVSRLAAPKVLQFKLIPSKLQLFLQSAGVEQKDDLAILRSAFPPTSKELLPSGVNENHNSKEKPDVQNNITVDHDGRPAKTVTPTAKTVTSTAKAVAESVAATVTASTEVAVAAVNHVTNHSNSNNQSSLHKTLSGNNVRKTNNVSPPVGIAKKPPILAANNNNNHQQQQQQPIQMSQMLHTSVAAAAAATAIVQAPTVPPDANLANDLANSNVPNSKSPRAIRSTKNEENQCLVTNADPTEQ